MSKLLVDEMTGFQVYMRILQYLKPLLVPFFISFVGFLIFAATQPLFPELLKHVIDAVEAKDTDARWILPFMAIGLFAIRGVGSFLGSYYIAYVSGKLIYAIQTEVFEHLMTVPTSYFDSTPSGQVSARVTTSVGMMTGALTTAVKVILREGLTVIGLLVYIFWKNWELSLIFLCMAPLIALTVSYTSKRFRHISHKIQDLAGDVLQSASEASTGHRVIRSFAGEQVEIKRFSKAAFRSFQQGLKMNRISAIHTPVLQLIIAVAIGAIFFMILLPSSLDAGNTGDLIAYITAVALIPKPIRQLIEMNVILQRSISGAQKIFAVLDMEPEKDTGTYSTERCKGKIEFKNVSFNYASSEDDVLKDISFTVEPGQTVALVGHSGSGKSTIASLIPRFYEASQGEILLDDIPLNDYKLTCLREQIAMVSQDVILFDATVLDNVAYASKEQSEERAWAALVAANADDFVRALPNGIHERLGENANSLSGGQRQRLAIARAIYKDAPLLLLDEATSALDTESENKIQAAIENAMENRTILVIAHRLSTIEKADQILVLDNGVIVERGSHKELLASSGYYARLHKLGFDDLDQTVTAAVEP